MSNKYSVIIIGAGKIGAFFDTPDSKPILTHAHAFFNHPSFEIKGFVDTDDARAQKAADIWGGNVKSSDAFLSEGIDVVCVAVPDEFHYPLLKQLSQYPVKLVLAEKPLTNKLDDCAEIVRLYSAKSTSLCLNYKRRFVPDFIELKWKIQRGLFGEYLTGAGYYGKGLLHNGSHLIDLIQFLLCDVVKAQKLKSEHDFFKDDPSISAVLTLKNQHLFFLQHIDCSLFTIFEIDLLFEKKRIRIIDSGFLIEEYDPIEDAVFTGYRNIKKVKEYSTSMEKALTNLVDNIYNHLENGQDLLCTQNDGYAVLKSCYSIIQSSDL